MAWIEAHQSLGEHPKLKKAVRLLGVPRPQLVGHLFYLWWWALDYAPDGDVSRYDAQELADAAKWEGDAEAFVGALTACRIGEREGFLERTPDGRLAIHDWWEYAGKLVQRRQSDAERKRRERSSGRPGPVRTVPPLPSADVRRTSDGHPADVRTHTTQPTEQTQPTPPAPLRGAAPDAAGAAPDAPLAVPVEGAGAVATSEPDRSRPRDPLWDAFQVVWPRGPRTATERGRWNKAAQEMRAGGVTSDEILLAAKHWPNVMGAVTMTPMGLAANLSLLLEGPQVNGRSNGTVQEHRQRVTQTAIAPVSSRQLIEHKRAQRALARSEDPRDG